MRAGRDAASSSAAFANAASAAGTPSAYERARDFVRFASPQDTPLCVKQTGRVRRGDTGRCPARAAVRDAEVELGDGLLLGVGADGDGELALADREAVRAAVHQHVAQVDARGREVRRELERATVRGLRRLQVLRGRLLDSPLFSDKCVGKRVDTAREEGRRTPQALSLSLSLSLFRESQ